MLKITFKKKPVNKNLTKHFAKNNPIANIAAVHEAGHAAMSLILDLKLEYVDIQYFKDRGGITSYYCQDDNAGADFLILLAGTAAERLLLKSSCQEGYQDDLNQFLELTSKDAINPGIRVCKFILRKYKKGIKALSKALLKHGRLEGDEAKVIFWTAHYGVKNKKKLDDKLKCLDKEITKLAYYVFVIAFTIGVVISSAAYWYHYYMNHINQ